MKKSLLGTALLLAVVAQSSLAETPTIKPGLWQSQINFKTESGELEKQMAQMRKQLEQLPEAQRQMMSNMMKSQGVDFDFETQAFKSCISKERAERGDFTLSENDECETTDITQQNGNTVLHFSCDSDQAQSSGQVTFYDDTHYSGESHTTTDINGQQEHITMTHSGEWLGADCGDLQPQ
jgi:TolA-binding protein